MSRGDGYGVLVTAVLVTLAWGVALAVQERAWAEVVHQDAMTSWAADGRQGPAPALTGAEVWAPLVIRQALAVGMVGLVSAALVRHGRSLPAMACAGLLVLPPAGLGTTALREPMMPGPYADASTWSTWWPWSGTALLLLAVAAPALVAAHRRVVAPARFGWRSVVVVTVLVVAASLSQDAASLAAGTAWGVQVLVEVATVVGVVVATSVLVSTSRRVGWTVLGLALAGGLLALLDSWYEARWDTVQLGAAVVLGPVLLVSAAPAGRLWRAVFRRGPGLAASPA